MAALAAVLGFPAAHSLSPRIHNYWFSINKIPGQYCAIETPSAVLKFTLESLPRLGFVGVNVTIPLKVDALNLSDLVSPAARSVGAANMLTFTDRGIVADNTDIYGFTWNIRQHVPAWSPVKAAVLGAGGAARAVLVALKNAGAAQILVSNRTIEKAEEIAEHLDFKIDIIPWNDREDMLDGCDTLINTTALGMIGKEPLALRLDCLPTAALVNDIVYTPLQTDLLRHATKRGNTVIDGLGMLLHQAVPAFERWFGVRPEVNQTLRDLVLKR